MQEGAVCFEKVAVAGGAVELTPRATVGMTVGAEVAQAQPAAIATATMGTEVHRGIDLTRTALGQDDRGGWQRRGRLGMGRHVLTEDTMRLVREAGKQCGLSGALTG